MKKRLDQLLVDLELFDSREKARTAIMTNKVKVNGKLSNKAGFQFNEDVRIEIDSVYPYVSRGAEKLKTAYEHFNLNFENTTVLDIGASTGGFTDFVLQHGASKSIAVDVGKAQLASRLVENPKVQNLEGINFRYLKYEDLKPNAHIDFVVADLSFISLTKIIKVLTAILEANKAEYSGEEVKIIFLIKPQFEAGKEIVDKCSGVIKDSKIREKILEDTIENILKEDSKLIFQGSCESSIKGAKGNIEYLAYFVYK